MRMALAASLGSGLVSAVFSLSAVFGGFGALILGYLTTFPLFLVGLSLGFPAALIAGLAGSAAVLLMSGSLLAAAVHLVTGALPVLLVVKRSLLARPASEGPEGGIEWYPPGSVLMELTGLGVAAFLAVTVLALGEPGGLEGVVQRALSGLAGEVFDAQGAPAPEPGAYWIVSAMPGLAAISWLTMAIVNAALAQGVLMRFGRNRRPPMRLDDIDLPQWTVPAFLALVAGASVAPDPVGFIALNMALILAVPIAFAGLSVVHAMARGRAARTPILVGFYMCLFLFGWPIVLMVGLGMIEQWMGLRRRFRPAGPHQEDE